MSEGHSYPSKYPRTEKGDSDLDTAWDILDTIRPGAIPDDVRFFLAGQIVGHMIKARFDAAAVAADWFTIAPRYRTKARLMEMLRTRNAKAQQDV